MRILRFLFLLLGLAAAAGTAVAQAYPDKSRVVTIIHPGGAGGLGDLVARAYARGLADTGGLNVIVEDKPGAEGVVAMRAAKAVAADGYTFVQASSSNMVLNAIMLPNLPYDPTTDFVPVSGIGRTPLFLLVGTNSPYKSAREFIAAARAQPGKLTFGSSTTTTRLGGELLQRLAGIKLLNVPYKNIAQALTALGAGEIDAVFSDLGSGGALLKAGRIRPLAATGTNRALALPNIPTLREEGVADYELGSWYAMYAPAKTPPEAIAAMRGALRKAAGTSHVTQAFANFGMEPLDLSGEEVAALQNAELKKWGELVRAANLAPAK